MADSNPANFLFVAGLPCLDLINTEPVLEGQRVDLLGGFADLIEWLEQAGLLSRDAARQATDRWGKCPQGEATLRQAVALRAALRVGAERLVAGKPVGGELVTTINRVLASRPVYRQLARNGKTYVSHFVPLSDEPLHLLVPVAESAAWLLEQGDRSLLRRCEGPDCVLFFYDTTKNKSRRWCSMTACGSRAKAAAYYHRKHAHSH